MEYIDDWAIDNWHIVTLYLPEVTYPINTYYPEPTYHQESNCYNAPFEPLLNIGLTELIITNENQLTVEPDIYTNSRRYSIQEIYYITKIFNEYLDWLDHIEINEFESKNIFKFLRTGYLNKFKYFCDSPKIFTEIDGFDGEIINRQRNPEELKVFLYVPTNHQHENILCFSEYKSKCFRRIEVVKAYGIVYETNSNLSRLTADTHASKLGKLLDKINDGDIKITKSTNTYYEQF